MGREDVERALRAMDDEDIRERLSQGDFEAVSGLDLTDEERVIVKDAAGDYPEVAGFSFEDFTLFTGLHTPKTIDARSSPAGYAGFAKFQFAVQYIQQRG